MRLSPGNEFTALQVLKSIHRETETNQSCADLSCRVKTERETLNASPGNPICESGEEFCRNCRLRLSVEILLGMLLLLLP